MRIGRMFIGFMILVVLLVEMTGACLALKRAVPETTKEAIVEKYLMNRSLDPVEGVWSLLAEDGHYLECAIMRNTTDEYKTWNYIGVLVSPVNEFGKVGEVKLGLRNPASPGLYRGFYVNQVQMGLVGPKGQFELGTNFSLIQSDMMQAKLPRGGGMHLQTLLRTDRLIGVSTGNGFFITSGLVATNYSVIEGAATITVTWAGQKGAATVLSQDAANDVAILKVSGWEQQAVPLPMGDPEMVRIKDTVYTVGLPASPKEGEGFITDLKKLAGDLRLFQVSMPIQPGTSGGPLLNSHGRVVGVVSAKLGAAYASQYTGADPQDNNYAVKSTVLRDISPVDISPLFPLAPTMSEPLPYEELMKKAVKGIVFIEAAR